MVIYKIKNSDACKPPVFELIDTLSKHNTVITIKCGAYFLFWNFSFKVGNSAWVVPSFGGQFILR